MGDLERLAEQL